MSADTQSVSVFIKKRVKIWDGRKKVPVEIQKTPCEGRNTDNLIESTCCYLEISREDVFFQILVEYTCFAMKIVRNEYQKLQERMFF